jgi:hypothetical protein
VEEPDVRPRGEHRQHRTAIEEAGQRALPSGAKLPGKHPKLEGGGGTVRYLRFTDEADVARKKKDLEKAIRAWITLKEG